MPEKKPEQEIDRLTTIYRDICVALLGESNPAKRFAQTVRMKEIRERLQELGFSASDVLVVETEAKNIFLFRKKNALNDKEGNLRMPMPEDKVVDLVIIVALPLERDAVLRRLPSPERSTSKGRVFYKAELPTKGGGAYSVILLPLSGMGTASAAVATTQAIDVWNPRFLFLTGITGGVRKELERRLGDVVVADQIVGYELGKIKDDSVYRRYEAFRPAHSLLLKAQDFAKNGWTSRIDIQRPDGSPEEPKVHFGVVASGDKVISAQSFVDDISSDWPRLVGVEMEGLGMALAAYQAETSPGVLFIKSISDWADSTKADNWQPYAADVAAAFTQAFLESEPFTPGVQRQQALRVEVRSFSGKHKIRLCSRLGDDWHDLADYFDIPSHHRRRFSLGRECQGIWEWLESRCKLDGLPEALEFIGREDLAKILGSADVT